MYHSVLSQSTRVTDGQTGGQTDGQNYDFQDRPRICSRGKIVVFRYTIDTPHNSAVSTEHFAVKTSNSLVAVELELICAY